MERGMGLVCRQDFDPYDLQPGVLHTGMCYATWKRDIRVQMGLRLIDTWCWHGESTLDYPGRPSVIIWTLQSRGRQRESEIQWLRWGRRGWRRRRPPHHTWVWRHRRGPWAGTCVWWCPGTQLTASKDGGLSSKTVTRRQTHPVLSERNTALLTP